MTELVELLPEKKQALILELVINMLPDDPDDILTPEDLAAIAKADEEFARGEYVDLEDYIAGRLAREAEEAKAL